MACSLICSAALVAVAVWWVALKKRVVPPVVCKVYCTLSVLFLVCATGFVTFIIELPRRAGWTTREATSTACALACAIIFRSVFFMNPQITVHIDESEIKWSDIPNRTCVLCNHTSFMDALIFTSYSPISFIINARTLMKSSLRQLPIFGGVFDRVGHFPVYFKSDESGVFSVDKDRQAVVNERVVSHIKRDGRLSIFPEGQMNKNPAQLLPFRNGTFQTVLDNKLEMYYCVMWGNEQVWHSSSSIPAGGPHDIYIKIGRIGMAKEGEDNAALSIRCQGILQEAVTEISTKANAKSK